MSAEFSETFSKSFDDALDRGLVLFNARDYFGAHESWEVAWQAERGRPRDFLQGLIQLAAAMHKLVDDAQPAGAAKLFGMARGKLEPFRPRFAGIDVDRVLVAADDRRKAASRPGAAAADDPDAHFDIERDDDPASGGTLPQPRA